MKFVIYKRSGEDDKPSKNAKIKWYKEDEEIRKDWFIEINTLEELIELLNEVEDGICIERGIHNQLQIGICDEWRYE